MIVARRNDGVTESFAELVALPPDEGQQKVTFAGSRATGAPGPMRAISVVQEGDYIAICFIPQGTTELPDFNAPAPSSGASMGPASAAPLGPPLFLLGMKQEFTVTAAGSSPGPIPSPAPSAMPGPTPAV